MHDVLYGTEADPGGGAPLIFRPNQLRPEGPKKNFFETGLPPLTKGLDDCPPPHPYMKAWIRQCGECKNRNNLLFLCLFDPS